MTSNETAVVGETQAEEVAVTLSSTTTSSSSGNKISRQASKKTASTAKVIHRAAIPRQTAKKTASAAAAIAAAAALPPPMGVTPVALGEVKVTRIPAAPIADKTPRILEAPPPRDRVIDLATSSSEDEEKATRPDQAASSSISNQEQGGSDKENTQQRPQHRAIDLPTDSSEDDHEESRPPMSKIEKSPPQDSQKLFSGTALEEAAGEQVGTALTAAPPDSNFLEQSKSISSTELIESTPQSDGGADVNTLQPQTPAEVQDAAAEVVKEVDEISASTRPQSDGEVNLNKTETTVVNDAAVPEKSGTAILPDAVKHPEVSSAAMDAIVVRAVIPAPAPNDEARSPQVAAAAAAAAAADPLPSPPPPPVETIMLEKEAQVNTGNTTTNADSSTPPPQVPPVPDELAEEDFDLFMGGSIDDKEMPVQQEVSTTSDAIERGPDPPMPPVPQGDASDEWKQPSPTERQTSEFAAPPALAESSPVRPAVAASSKPKTVPSRAIDLPSSDSSSHSSEAPPPPPPPAVAPGTQDSLLMNLDVNDPLFMSFPPLDQARPAAVRMEGNRPTIDLGYSRKVDATADTDSERKRGYSSVAEDEMEPSRKRRQALDTAAGSRLPLPSSLQEHKHPPPQAPQKMHIDEDLSSPAGSSEHLNSGSSSSNPITLAAPDDRSDTAAAGSINVAAPPLPPPQADNMNQVAAAASPEGNLTPSGIGEQSHSIAAADAIVIDSDADNHEIQVIPAPVVKQEKLEALTTKDVPTAVGVGQHVATASVEAASLLSGNAERLSTGGLSSLVGKTTASELCMSGNGPDTNVEGGDYVDTKSSQHDLVMGGQPTTSTSALQGSAGPDDRRRENNLLSPKQPATAGDAVGDLSQLASNPGYRKRTACPSQDGVVRRVPMAIPSALMRRRRFRRTRETSIYDGVPRKRRAACKAAMRAIARGSDSSSGGGSSDSDSDPGGSEEDEYEIKPHVNMVEHLSYKIVNPKSGLPIWKFTAFAGQDDVLFDFTVDIKPSQIPGAGNGAFLTFTGARRLRPEAKRRGDWAMEQRRHYVAKTKRPLEAITPDGYGISVKLTGEDLHGNQNNDFWPSTEVENPVVPPLKRGIGFLGMHRESDYLPDHTIRFSSKENSILIGRYGPFLRNDRKPEQLYTLKGFIFGNEPLDWGFGVDETLFGDEQIIDITDDTTGSPHWKAQENICMYVNEVGHSRDLRQNVYIGNRHGRIVQYYADLPEPMEQGQSVELLTNYKKAYETIRERKGYGLKNLRGLEEGDESRFHRFKRNFMERVDVEEIVKQLRFLGVVEHIPELTAYLPEDDETEEGGFVKLCDMIGFVYKRIWRPLFENARGYLRLLYRDTEIVSLPIWELPPPVETSAPEPAKRRTSLPRRVEEDRNQSENETGRRAIDQPSSSSEDEGSESKRDVTATRRQVTKPTSDCLVSDGAAEKPTEHQADAVLSSGEAAPSPRSDKNMVCTMNRQQWVALRRIQWMCKVFQTRLRQFEAILEKGETTLGRPSVFPYRPLMNKAVKRTTAMSAVPLGRVLDLAAAGKEDEYGYSIGKAVLGDMTEEVCFRLRDTLVGAFDKSRWCEVAQSLTQKLCTETARLLLSPNDGIGKVQAEASLRKGILQAIKDATQDVWSSVATCSTDRLSFASGLTRRIGGNILISQSQLQQLESAVRSKSFFTGNNSSLPKALVARMVERLVKQGDAVSASALNATFTFAEVDQIQVSSEYLIVKLTADDICGGDPQLEPLGSFPRLKTDVSSTAFEINTYWYLVWQVAYPAHCVAKHFLTNLISIEEYCEALGSSDIAPLVEFAVGDYGDLSKRDNPGGSPRYATDTSSPQLKIQRQKSKKGPAIKASSVPQPPVQSPTKTPPIQHLSAVSATECLQPNSQSDLTQKSPCQSMQERKLRMNEAEVSKAPAWPVRTSPSSRQPHGGAKSLQPARGSLASLPCKPSLPRSGGESPVRRPYKPSQSHGLKPNPFQSSGQRERVKAQVPPADQTPHQQPVHSRHQATEQQLSDPEGSQSSIPLGKFFGTVRARAILVREGPPDARFPGDGGKWPPGWIQKTYKRASGATASRCDRYWFSPKEKYKLRSFVEIKKFTAHLKGTNGNEKEAWLLLKGRQWNPPPATVSNRPAGTGSTWRTRQPAPNRAHPLPPSLVSATQVGNMRPPQQVAYAHPFHQQGVGTTPFQPLQYRQSTFLQHPIAMLPPHPFPPNHVPHLPNSVFQLQPPTRAARGWQGALPPWWQGC